MESLQSEFKKNSTFKLAVILLTLYHTLNVLSRLIIISLFLLTLCQGVPEDRLPQSVSTELQKSPHYQEGAKAMATYLPDIAVTQFRLALRNKKLSKSTRAYIQQALAKALIQLSASEQGNPKQAEEALSILKNSTLPTTPLLRSKAFISLGKFKSAEKVLANIPKKHPYYQQLQLARARILIALNRPDEALALLVNVAKSKHSATRNSANLLAAEIYIQKKHYALAQKALSQIDPQQPQATQLQTYIQAKLALAQGNYPQAENLFQSLISDPNHLSKRIYHHCFLGLADAQSSNKNIDAAILTLEEFIEDHPESQVLQAAFKRLINFLPKNLSSDHPSLNKLQAWSNLPPLSNDIIYISGNSAATIPLYQAILSEYDDRASLALYYRAKLLSHSTELNDHLQALALLNYLRMQHVTSPDSPSALYDKLASLSLIDTAQIQLKLKHPDLASFSLTVLDKIAYSPQLKNQAAYLNALLLSEENQLSDALAVFQYAMESSDKTIAQAASLNAGILALQTSKLTSFGKILSSSKKESLTTSLQLERALWKCSQHILTGRAELETFIINHPNHPRENEARIALAEACVHISPPDVTLAKAQIDIIAPRLPKEKDQLRITKILIRAENLNKNWLAAAKAAEAFITRFNNSAGVPSIMLKQGLALYHNEDFNKAQRIFLKLTTEYPKSNINPLAQFYAAMSARLGGTTQAREECIQLFEKVIRSNSPLAPEARIQQSRILIDLNRNNEAESTLAPLLSSKKTPRSLRHDASILMADSLHRQGSSDPKKYTRAIKIYSQLLSEKNLPLARKNSIHYLQGQTYEAMNLPSKAFSSYYSVISSQNTPDKKSPHEEEWLWFYKCGFKALTMLENDHRWRAAVKLARLLASFHGPRSEEATQRANNLAKKHMIWEDEDPMIEESSTTTTP